MSKAVACAVWLPAASVAVAKLYGDEVSVLTSCAVDAEFDAGHTRVVAGIGRERHARTLVNCWPLVGLVRLTVGGVFCGGVVPPLQAVPFSVNAVGALLVPLNVPLKPAVKLWPLPMLWFQSALLATVICALPAGCVKETGQPFCKRCPFGKLNSSVQPLVMAAPLLVMTMLAPKPLPPSQLFVYVTWQAGACATAVIELSASAQTAAAVHARRRRKGCMSISF